MGLLRGRGRGRETSGPLTCATQSKKGGKKGKKGLAASRFAGEGEDAEDADAGDAAEAAAEGESGDEPDGSSAALALVRAPLCVMRRYPVPSPLHFGPSYPFPFRLPGPCRPVWFAANRLAPGV